MVLKKEIIQIIIVLTIFFDMMVKTAAPRQMRMFVLSPADFLLNSLSAPIAVPSMSANTRLKLSDNVRSMALPFGNEF